MGQPHSSLRIDEVPIQSTILCSFCPFEMTETLDLKIGKIILLSARAAMIFRWISCPIDTPFERVHFLVVRIHLAAIFELLWAIGATVQICSGMRCHMFLRKKFGSLSSMTSPRIMITNIVANLQYDGSFEFPVAQMAFVDFEIVGAANVFGQCILIR